MTNIGRGELLVLGKWRTLFRAAGGVTAGKFWRAAPAVVAHTACRLGAVRQCVRALKQEHD